MTASELLVRAKSLILDERAWWDGRSNRFDPRQGVFKRCAAQALDVAGVGYLADECAVRAAWEYMRKVMKTGIPAYNDTHTHAEVLAVFDKAIELAHRSTK